MDGLNEQELADSKAMTSSEGPERKPYARWLMVASYLGTGALLLFAIWRALPARWLPVDTIGSLLGVAAIVAGVLVAKEHPRAKMVGLWVSGILLVVGTTVCLSCNQRHQWNGRFRIGI